MANPDTPDNVGASSSKKLHVALWVVQSFLAVVFVGTGIWKLTTPTTALARMIPWAGEVSPAFLGFVAVVDLAGGVGLVLPSLTRIRPGVVVPAAVGCTLLQLAAVGFHFSRGEAANTPFNVLLMGLSLFVAWGRHKAPIPAR